MKTFAIALLLWTITVAAFATAILRNSNPLAQLVWGLIVFWFCGSIIPCTLEDIGEFLADYLHLYGPAKVLLLVSHFLYQLPLFGNKETRALAAEALSRITLVLDDKNDSRIWANRALQIDGVNWGTRFQVLSAAGKVYFSIGQDDVAEKYLNDASDIFASNIERFRLLSDKLSEIQAYNLDLLAQIKIKTKRYDEAEDLFKRSARLRNQTKTLIESALAYAENTQGIAELLKGNSSAAETRFLAAAHELPANPQLVQHREVVVSVLSSLKRLGSETARKTYNSLFSRYKNFLHTAQIQYLERQGLNDTVHPET